MPELIWTHSSQLQKSSAHCRNLVSAQVWRVAAAAAIATCIFGFRLGLSLGYGLDFFLGTLALERGTLTLIGYWFYGFLPKLFSLSRLRCLGVASVPKVGWKYCYIFYSETSTPIFLTGYGPTLSSDILTTGRYIGRIFSVTVAVAVKFFLQQQNPNTLVKTP